jgi:hypothetical protein
MKKYEAHVRSTNSQATSFTDEASAWVLDTTAGVGTSPTAPLPPQKIATPAVAPAGSGELRVEWNAPYSEVTIRYYDVEYTPMGGTAMVHPPVTATMVILRSLTNGTEHSIRVRAVADGVAAGPWSEVAKGTPTGVGGTTGPTGPTGPTTTGSMAPASVTAAAAGTTSITVTWTQPASSPEDVEWYEVVWMEGATATLPPNPAPANAEFNIAPHLRTFTIRRLKGATAYHVGVRTVTFASDASEWVDDTATTLTPPPTPTAPAAPMGVNATPGDASVTVSWEAVTGATAYMVQWRTANQTFSSTSQMMQVLAPLTMAKVPSLTNGMEYMFQVKAGNAGGYGAPSMPEVKATPVDPTVGGDGPFVTDVTVSPQLRNEIKVSWKYDESATGAATSQRFDVGWTDADGERFTATLAPQTIVAAPGGRVARSHVLTGLKVNQKYLIAVRAVHATSTGTVITPVRTDWRYPAAREMTPAGVSMVQNVQVGAGDGRLMVTWDAVKTVGDCMHAPAGSDPCGYRVEWRAANQSYDDPQRQKDLKGVDLATRYTIPGLTNGTEYHVVVSSYNERSTTRSPNSAEARQTPMAPAEGMLEAPNPVEAVAGDMEVTVKWTAVEDATGYRVQWRTASQSYDSSRQHDGFYAYRSGDLVLSHTVEDLENGMDYMFRVMAMGDGGMMSGPSDEVSAMPMMPTPALPVFGALVLGAGLVAAGRRRLRARRQRLVKA